MKILLLTDILHPDVQYSSMQRIIPSPITKLVRRDGGPLSIALRARCRQYFDAMINLRHLTVSVLN
jgi:hypothetical protein